MEKTFEDLLIRDPDAAIDIPRPAVMKRPDPFADPET
jgi:hypothetical protein